MKRKFLKKKKKEKKEKEKEEYIDSLHMIVTGMQKEM